VDRASAPAQTGRGGIEELHGGWVQPGVGIDVPPLQRLIGFALAGQRALTGLRAAGADVGGALARGGVQEFAGRQCGHLDVQVDAIQQRAGEPPW
jgi:hypothetical protein